MDNTNFPLTQKWDDDLTISLAPEFSEMSKDELEDYISRAEDVLHDLHHYEPDDSDEQHSKWEEKFELVED